jgi:hypothetical protein
MKPFIKVAPHIAIVLSVVFIVFLVLDQFNPTMNFVNNDISMAMLWVLCLASLLNAVLLIAVDRRR